METSSNSCAGITSCSDTLRLSFSKLILNLTKSGRFLRSVFSGIDNPISNLDRGSTSASISTVRVTPTSRNPGSKSGCSGSSIKSAAPKLPLGSSKSTLTATKGSYPSFLTLAFLMSIGTICGISNLLEFNKISFSKSFFKSLISNKIDDISMSFNSSLIGTPTIRSFSMFKLFLSNKF